MKPDRLDDIVTRLRAFVAEREWAPFHDPKNLAMVVASEAGQLLAEFRWVANARADSWSLQAENKERVALRAADVGIALCLLCDRLGVDLADAVLKKIKLNAQKFPVHEAKGQYTKPGS